MPFTASNYPPGVSGNEPQITGESAEVGLVCQACGEGFDSLESAADHVLLESENPDCEEALFALKPIEEVF